MRERMIGIGRAAVGAMGAGLGWVGATIVGWIRGDDLSAVIVLGVVALFTLFVVVPNRRRY